MIIRPAAVSLRICSAVRCGSRRATACICAVTVPKRAASNCVLAWASRGLAKSMAVRSETPGMPGVSGELNAYGVPIAPRLAKEPGVVPSSSVEGLSPTGGSTHERSTVCGEAMLVTPKEFRFAAERHGRGEGCVDWLFRFPTQLGPHERAHCSGSKGLC